MTHRLRWRVPVASAACLLTLVAGCSSQPRQVKCNGRLEPINPPVLKHFVSELPGASGAVEVGTREAPAAASAPP